MLNFNELLCLFSETEDDLSFLREENEESFFRLIKEHKIINIINERVTILEKANILNSFQLFLSPLRKQALYNTISNLNKIKQLIVLCNTLIEYEIAFALYKGPALSEFLFKNPILRHFNDLDIIISQKDFNKTIYGLKKLGYKPLKLPNKVDTGFFEKNHEITLFSHDKASIDLHWRFMSKDFFDCDLEYLENQNLVTEVEIQNNSFKTLGYDFLPVALAVHHGGTELWSKLKYVLDWKYLLDNCSEQINWERTQSIAKDKGVYKFLLISLAITNQLFSTKLPEILLQDVRSKPILKAAMTRINYLECRTSSKELSWTFKYWYRIYYKDGKWFSKTSIIIKYFQKLGKYYNHRLFRIILISFVII